MSLNSWIHSGGSETIGTVENLVYHDKLQLLAPNYFICWIRIRIPKLDLDPHPKMDPDPDPGVNLNADLDALLCEIVIFLALVLQ